MWCDRKLDADTTHVTLAIQESLGAEAMGVMAVVTMAAMAVVVKAVEAKGTSNASTMVGVEHDNRRSEIKNGNATTSSLQTLTHTKSR